MRNFANVAGPMMGVEKIPFCINGTICSYLKSTADYISQYKFVQHYLAPAGYWRDRSSISSFSSSSSMQPLIKQKNDNNKYRTTTTEKFLFYMGEAHIDV